jgi:acetylornithine deacetylase/succinyl-diaminopimelate desuccinylase-like protein
MSKQIIKSVLNSLISYKSLSFAELNEARASIRAVFDSVVDDKSIEMAFVEAAFNVLKVSFLAYLDDSDAEINKKIELALKSVNSLRYKLCNDQGVITRS